MKKVMKYSFATLFDKNYLSRGLALLHSLDNHCSQYCLYILCLDDHVKQYFELADHKNVQLITLSDLENGYPELLAAKRKRSVVEYYFTLSPFLPHYILQKYENVPAICFLVADIYFFSSPEKVFQLLKHNSIIITPHKFSEELKNSGFEKHGKFNVSFQIFKNNIVGLECLKNWQQSCINWCYDYLDPISGNFADQKYLDYWSADFKDEVYVLADEVTGLAVWNIDNYNFSLIEDIVYSNNKPVIFYHFHHFKIINNYLALNGFGEYMVKNASGVIRNNIYLPYWKELEKFSKQTINTEISIRLNLQKTIFRLLLIHQTCFIKIFNKIISINLKGIINLHKEMKWRT